MQSSTMQTLAAVLAAIGVVAVVLFVIFASNHNTDADNMTEKDCCYMLFLLLIMFASLMGAAFLYGKYWC